MRMVPLYYYYCSFEYALILATAWLDGSLRPFLTWPTHLHDSNRCSHVCSMHMCYFIFKPKTVSFPPFTSSSFLCAGNFSDAALCRNIFRCEYMNAGAKLPRRLQLFHSIVLIQLTPNVTYDARTCGNAERTVRLFTTIKCFIFTYAPFEGKEVDSFSLSFFLRSPYTFEPSETLIPHLFLFAYLNAVFPT